MALCPLCGFEVEHLERHYQEEHPQVFARARNRHRSKRDAYKPIRDYGLLGDSRTAALVGLDGSIDWMCWPRFDSGSVFGAILDSEKGGRFAVTPAGRYRSTQEYVSATNVLVTFFETDRGRVELVDFLAVEGNRQLCRIITARSGEMELKIDFSPRFDYGRVLPKFSKGAKSVLVSSTRESFELFSSVSVDVSDHSAGGTITVRAGDKAMLAFGEKGMVGRSLRVAESALVSTTAYWRNWLATSPYEGPWKEWVTRSALVMKALTYEPTGLAIASPTTSLPEKPGGDKNWDYRYVWMRDAAMVLEAMFHLGHMGDQGARYMDFLAEQAGRDPAGLCVMYDVDGLRLQGEELLTDLDGYRGSKPVRIGNQAAFQFQLDTYGEVLYTAYRFADMVGELPPAVWETMLALAEYIIDNWSRPDKGIWEERGEERHYTQSKAMCAVGLRAVIKSQAKTGYPGPTERWQEALARIEKTVLTNGWNPRLRSFTKFFDSDELDASVLLLSVYGFLPSTDPRIQSTVDVLLRNLGHKGFMYRFKYPGLELAEGEGAFAIATMWLAMHFIRVGREDFARKYIDAIIGTANHVGLFAEEFDPRNGDFLGNFPQLFVHAALVDAIHNYQDMVAAKSAS